MPFSTFLIVSISHVFLNNVSTYLCSGVCSSCASILVHRSLTLSHLCFSLVCDCRILGFTGRIVRCVIYSSVDIASNSFADAVDAFQA